ncbi:MAG: hypothetical protein AAF671_06865, partial [Pseudomonadota bacterium]
VGYSQDLAGGGIGDIIDLIDLPDFVLAPQEYVGYILGRLVSIERDKGECLIFCDYLYLALSHCRTGSNAG